MKFSVIIPSIGKGGKHFIDNINNAIACDGVGEIIIINNDAINLKKSEIPKHNKILYIEPNENIFVNPAWNMGVRVAKYTNIIISNDDISFDYNLLINIFTELEEKQNKKLSDLGFIGPHIDNWNKNSSNTINIKLQQIVDTVCWGCLIIFDKRNWVPIPDKLKIHYGDTFIISIAQSINKPILQLVGFPISGNVSASAASPEFKEILNTDTKHWQELIAIGTYTIET